MKKVRIAHPQLMPVMTNDPMQMQQTLNKLVAAVQPLVGQNPSRLEKAVTFADLADSGFYVDGGINGIGGGSIVVPPPVKPDPMTPPAVTGFSATSTWQLALLSWNPAGYKQHAFVQVWRADGFKDENNSVPTSVNDAVLVGVSDSTSFGDNVVSNHFYRYWVRNVSTDNLNGPWHVEAGSVVHAPRSPSDYLDIISGEIKQDDLFLDLSKEIDKIGLLEIKTDKTDAAVSHLSTSVSDLESAQASLTTQVAANTVLTDANGKQIGHNTSAISTQAVAITDLEKATASLTTQVTANKTTIQQQYQVISEHDTLIKASYTVKIDTGSVITGFGLMVDDAGSSSFAVRAHRFYIAPPTVDGKDLTDDYIPFIVDGNNVLIKNAYIDNAFIESLVTGSLVAQVISGETITGTHIRGGDITIGNNFTVNGSGDVVAKNVFLTGRVDATSGTFTNVTIAESCDVKGTVYANKIKGDVVSGKLKPVTAATVTGSSWVTVFTSTFEASSMLIPRSVYVGGVTIAGTSFDGQYSKGGSGAEIEVRVMVGASQVLIKTFSCVLTKSVDLGDEGGTVEAYFKGDTTVSGGKFVDKAAGSISIQVRVKTNGSGTFGDIGTVVIPAQNVLVQLVPIGEEIV